MPPSSVDPGGLAEFSVVFTDRSLNHMSRRFGEAMRDVSAALKEVYGAEAVALVPGGGTFAMEAVSRQLATGRRALVLRNGWFSYRWTQILDAGGIAEEVVVLKARRTGNAARAPFAPCSIDEAARRIAEERPDIVFAPHVETSAGLMLPDDYVAALAQAAHDAGAILALDCIASGAMWVDMRVLGVDVLISAPQKGWSASPSAGLVMLGERAVAAMEGTASTSFALDLAKWLSIMRAFEGGGHAYHATMPTDALMGLRDAIAETRAMGFDVAKARQAELGRKVRALLVEFGHPSVAAPGFEAPGVVVSYTDDPAMKSGARFAAQGMQIAAGVPLMCDEGDGFATFRLGLFGLDKLMDVDGTVARLRSVIETLTEPA